jgi:hypothetical protein
MSGQVFSNQFLLQQVEQAKVHFERALDCKHTEFDDLYPYMIEHPHFFWYKRYVAWAELLTLIKIANELDVDWTPIFTSHQTEFVRQRVMSSTVLDTWFTAQDSEKISGSLEQ